MIRKIKLFLMCLFITGVANAGVVVVNSEQDFNKPIPVNLVSLYEALVVIDVVDANNRDEQAVQAARDRLYAFFADANGPKVYSINQMYTACKQSVKNVKSCKVFIDVYVGYNGNHYACTLADATRVEYNGRTATYSECIQYIDTTGYNMDGTKIEDQSETGLYTGNSFVGQCKAFIENVRQCSVYLESYYKIKLSESGLSDKELAFNQCMLDNIQRGHIKIPTSDMEKECK